MDDFEDETAEPEDAGQAAGGELIIPWQRLSAAALRGVIEEFVTREGTEYGAEDVELEVKVAEVRAQLERGEVQVLFDARAETINLVRADDRRGSAAP